ncbi:YigZ family protein [uncultured Chloroflexus sp.]|uniref:IMPACT family protein n=1 Tax=uncultured Chloroflexus sp. TaxID=214040 RepID=UPI0026203AE9|nr:YigZ family protein [uncultured Chloroflexus sp.]
MSATHYPIPAAPARTEIVVRGSRFIAQAIPTATVEAARIAIASARTEMPDATHHCFAYLIGYGTSTIAGMSDDGEPAGTAGRPMMAVLRGADLGDITVIVTRYFGGTLLGVGGLVRAYSDATRAVLAIVPRTQRVIYQRMTIRLPYSDYAPTRRILETNATVIVSESFAADVMIIADLPVDQITTITQHIREQSAGRAHIEPVTTMV